MRYSRMQKTDFEEEKSGKRGWMLVLILAAAVLIYFIGAEKAGAFLAAKVIEPVAGYFAGEKMTEDQDENLEKIAEEAVTAEIVFAPMEMYLLQTGVFEKEENALSAASELVAGGGAGYVYNDDGCRVFISGYTLRSDAENVKDRLKKDRNMDSKMLELITDEAVFSVTTRQEIADLFRKIAEDSSNMHIELIELSLKLDKGEITSETARKEIDVLRNSLTEYREQLSKLDQQTNDELIQKTLTYYTCMTEEFGRFDEDLSDTELSAALKHAYISAAYAYRDLTKTV